MAAFFFYQAEAIILTLLTDWLSICVNLIYDGGSVVAQFSTVPETEAAGLLTFLLVFAFGSRKRRRVA